MLTALLVAFVFAIACLMFDTYNTNKGIKAGVAVEGNTLIADLWGTKPTLWQLWSVEGTLRLLVLLAALFVPFPTVLAYAMGIGAFIAFGFKNIQGGRQWLWMFKNPGKPLPVMHSVWQKIVGFWG